MSNATLFAVPMAEPLNLGHAYMDGLIFTADLATTATFASLFQQLWTTREASGLSLQTLVAVVAVRCLHFLSYHFGIHYRPMGHMVTADMYYFMDIVNCVAGMACVALFYRHYGTYERIKDNFGTQIFDRVNWLMGCLRLARLDDYKDTVGASMLYLVVAVVALVWCHIKEAQHSFLLGYYMSFYEVLSAMALVPQLYMFIQERRVGSLMANFVVFTAVHKFLVFLFWCSFPLVTGGPGPLNRHVQMVFEFVNLLILSDFLYCWAKSRYMGYSEVILDLEMSAQEMAFDGQEDGFYTDHKVLLG